MVQGPEGVRLSAPHAVMKKRQKELLITSLGNRHNKSPDFRPFYKTIDNIFGNPTQRFPVRKCNCKRYFFLAMGRLLYLEGNDDLVNIFENIDHVYSFQDIFIVMKSLSCKCIPIYAQASGPTRHLCFHCYSGLLQEFISRTRGLKFISVETLSMAPKLLHEILRPHWFMCELGCLYQNSIQFSISLEGWQRKNKCIYIGIEYAIVRSSMPGLNIAIGQIVFRHNPSPNCECFESYFMILAGLLIENHSDSPERDFNHTNFQEEAILVYGMLRSLLIFQEQSTIQPEGMVHLKVYAPHFCFVLGKHPESCLSFTLYALYKNIAYVWTKRCGVRCVVKPMQKPRIRTI